MTIKGRKLTDAEVYALYTEARNRNYNGTKAKRSSRNGCRLPSDNLTDEDIAKLAGPVEVRREAV